MYGKIGKLARLFLILAFTLAACGNATPGGTEASPQVDTSPLIVQSTSEMELLETNGIIAACGQKAGVEVQMQYRGSVELRDNINTDPNQAHAYIAASPMWMTNSVIRDKVPLMMSLVTFLASPELQKGAGWTPEKGLTIGDLYDASTKNQLQMAMPSASQDDAGLNHLLAIGAGFKELITEDPKVLRSEDLTGPLLEAVQKYYASVRLTGSSAARVAEGIKNQYEAGNPSVNSAVLPESVAISLIDWMKVKGYEPMRVYYPQGAVSLQIYTAGYVDGINQSKMDQFHAFTKCLTSPEMRPRIQALGFRYSDVGITMPDADMKVFDPSIGIDTKTEFGMALLPKEPVITFFQSTYQTVLKVSGATVVCNDFSPSMEGEGRRQLELAMKSLLYEPEKHFLEAKKGDTYWVILFDGGILKEFSPVDGADSAGLKALYDQITKHKLGDATDFYRCAIRAMDILEGKDGARPEQISSIILVTDGEPWGSKTLDDLTTRFNALKHPIPVYTIMVGKAVLSQLEEISTLTKSGDVCDGRGGAEALIRCFNTFKGNN